MQGHTPRLIFIPDPRLGWKLSPYGRVNVKFRDVVQSTDSRGWRTVVNQPQNASLKVAFYGCSFTYGTGLTDEETFTSLLQQNYQDYRIMNRGIGGHGSVQNYIQFRKDVADQEVDVAIFVSSVITDIAMLDIP